MTNLAFSDRLFCPDAMVRKRTAERIQANRAVCQSRLYRHIAARFKAEVPWRRRKEAAS